MKLGSTEQTFVMSISSDQFITGVYNTNALCDNKVDYCDIDQFYNPKLSTTSVNTYSFKGAQ